MAIVLNAARLEVLEARIEAREDQLNELGEAWDKQAIILDGNLHMRAKVLAKIEEHPDMVIYQHYLTVIDKHIAERTLIVRELRKKYMRFAWRNEYRINEWRMCQLVMSYNE
jgi:hypothetical protein